MKRKRLANIQWRLMLFATALTGLVSLVTLTIVSQTLGLDTLALLTLRWLHMPLLAVVAVFAVASGLLTGYGYGNRLKRRLDRLVEAILHYERGDFGHRAPPLGDDELGLLAAHLNAMAARVEEQVASLQRLSTQVRQAAVVEERQRLARELHDAVSQQLFAISMLSSAVLEQIPGHENPLRRQITAIESMAGKAQDEMRALLLHLRPAVLEGKGLRQGLDEFMAAFRERHSIQVRWEIGELPPLPAGVEDHLFRIVQEALSNVLRHARATSVTVRLQAAGRQVRLKVIDDGVGFSTDQAKRSSYGLQVIRERASEVGGVAEIISIPGQGTQLEVKVPIVGTQGERAE
jgi:NarL family two-component system sensor histidine kinase LiaS